MSTNATAVVGIPSSDADSLGDNAALIGGIVGGIVALLVIGGLVAFIVARNRRNVTNEENAMASIAPALVASINNCDPYDFIPTIPNNSDRVGVDALSRNHYDVLNPNEV
jgi:hypothetical protein